MNRRIFAPLVLVLALGAGCDLQPNSHTFPGQKAVGEDGYTLTVGFDRVENLVPNSQVLLDNVNIGTITEIEVDDSWQAQVTLRIADDQPLPEGTSFRIGQKTLLGAQYVEVVRPTALKAGRVLADGDRLGAEHAGVYPSTEQVLGAASLLLNNGGLSQLSTITGELTAAFRGRGAETRELVTRIDELVTVLDDNRGDVVGALESLDGLSRDLRKDQAVIGRALERIEPGLQALNEERTRLVRTVNTLGRMGLDAERVIERNHRAILANLDSLRAVLQRLGKVAHRLPDALKIAFTIPFPAMTTSDAIRGDYANLFTTLDLSVPSLAEIWLRPGRASATAEQAPAASDPSSPAAPTPGTTTGPASPAPEPDPAPEPAPTSDPSPEPQQDDCSGLAALLGGCS